MNETAMNERFDRIDNSIERLAQGFNHRLDGIDKRLDGLTKYVMDFREEAIKRLEVIESRLDILSLTLASIDSRVPVLTKGVLDIGSYVSQALREQSMNKDSTADLAARVAKLEENSKRRLQRL